MPAGQRSPTGWHSLFRHRPAVLGICTSSATVGPSVSFGVADAVTIFSRNVALSDAWATAVCNEIRPDDRSVLDRVDPAEVSGIFAIMGDVTVRWGQLPPLVPAVVDEGLISAGDRFLVTLREIPRQVVGEIR